MRTASLFAIRVTRERRRKKNNLTIYILMARKPKRSQWAYREWALSDK